MDALTKTLFRKMLIFQYCCVCKCGLSNYFAGFSQGGDEDRDSLGFLNEYLEWYIIYVVPFDNGLVNVVFRLPRQSSTVSFTDNFKSTRQEN